MPPPLEAERVRLDKPLTPEQDTVKIVTGFECSTPLEIEKISPTHFSLRITTDSELKNWFMYRVEGVKGKTIRVDIKDAPLNKWWSLNPVYSYVSSIDAPESFAATTLSNPAEPIAAYNGPLLPDTSGQKWRFMPNVWTEQTGFDGEPGRLKVPIGLLSFVHTFDEDSAFVALKVPYTAKYNQAYVDSLRDNPHVTVVDVGQSVGKRPLHILRIGTGDPKQVPCIVLYAREHGSEHDSSWVVQGAIEHILRDTDEGKRLREQFTFLILPMLDPDAVAASKYENIIKHFVYTIKSGPESVAIANYFRKWVESGNRIDIVYNIHNVESAECGHLLSVVKDRGPDRGPASWSLDEDFLRPLTQSTIYRMEPRSQLQGELARFRLGGYLGFIYGPLHMPYEVNSQDKTRHLTLAELKGIGPLLVQSSTQFLNSEKSKALNNVVSEMRRRRDARVARFTNTVGHFDNALHVEWTSYERDVNPSVKGGIIR